MNELVPMSTIEVKARLSETIEFIFGSDQPLLISELYLVNNGTERHRNLVLEIAAETQFFECQVWQVNELAAGATVSLPERRVLVDEGFFTKLPERKQEKVHFRLLKDSEELFVNSQSVTLVPPDPRLSMIYDHSINYAFQQNSIPVIKEIRLQNNGVARRDLTLRLTTEPAFAPAVEIRLQSIAAGGEFRVAPPELKLKLSHDFLAELNEKVTGWLRLELIEGELALQEIKEPINLLARNEWCGLNSLPEILAAFILPNEPIVMTVLDRASDILGKATGRSALNGYQDKSKKRVWEQVAAIYKALAERGIRYINAPASFERSGQKVRYPSDVLSQRFANCLDISLLFAACCEQAGLRPLVFIHAGHAYAGCWLEERSLPEPAGDDLQYVRKLAADELITVLEPTLLTEDDPGTLNHAELIARSHLQKDDIFCLALDVRASRSARIKPLPVGSDGASAKNSAKGEAQSSSDDRIGDREFTECINVPEKTASTTSSRIDLWKSRLLDLTLRNRLLSFRETKATVRILAEPERVEDELAAERTLSLECKPKMMSSEDPRDAAIHTREQRADALIDHLREELQAGRLHTHLDNNEHQRRLTELFRSARTALEENGTNTLYAAVGILEWRETEHSDRIHRAPILLVPIVLKRRSILEGFSLCRFDEETRLNVTLMEMLKQHFRKDIAGLDPLPEDEKGVDVARVLKIFRDAVRNLSGWEVKEEVWLGQFSFTKFLLWKDLADRLDDLTKNRVVRHLVHDAGTPIENPNKDISERDIDDRVHPRDVLCPRSADSSQLAAVLAAADGHDFVLEGPPGTGKSQTITNIIAQCLAAGKRVLFVAEKRAALDVVHRRLREDGLAPFCLELHSNKTGKKEVIEQFRSTLLLGEEKQAAEWDQCASELHSLRASLNDYTRALHRPSSCGLSAYQCLDYILPRKEKFSVKMAAWQPLHQVSFERLSQAREHLRIVQTRSRSLQPLVEHGLSPLECSDYSYGFEERGEELNAALRLQCRSAIEVTKELVSWMKFERPLRRVDIERLNALVDVLVAAPPVGGSFATTSWQQLSQSLESVCDQVEERGRLRNALAKIQSPPSTETCVVACEGISPQLAEQISTDGRLLRVKLAQAQEAAIAVIGWLNAQALNKSRAQLLKLSLVAEAILKIEDVGASFPIAQWDVWSSEIERWAKLVQERISLRSQLSDYSEGVLLSLDLDKLKQKWERSQSTWFLPRIVNRSSVMRSLRSAHQPKTHSDASQLGVILGAALRLREVNRQLNEVADSARSMLAVSWREGEPDYLKLTEVLSWGGMFNERLRDLVGEDQGLEEKIRAVVSLSIQQGIESLRKGGAAGNKLAALIEMFSDFDSASLVFAAVAELEQSLLTDSVNYFNAVENSLATYNASAPRLRQINAEISARGSSLQNALGSLWNGGEPSAEDLRHALSWGERLHTRLQSFAGDEIGWLGGFRQMLAVMFADGAADFLPDSPIVGRMTHFSKKWLEFDRSLSHFASEVQLRRDWLDSSGHYLQTVASLLERLAESWSKVREWCLWQKARREAVALGLSPVIEALEAPNAHEIDVNELFELSFRRALLVSIADKEPVLRDFLGDEQNERIERFRGLDGKMAKLSRDLIRARLARGVPRDDGRSDIPKEQIGLLRRELAKQKRHIPVRQLISKIPSLLPRLKPCVLMSPLSVAQYLEASHETFDVVIFDEASQIPVWDAVGAIARGKQLIVVGDPKQLPPTNFFASNPDDDDLTPDEHKDLESILDELLTHGLRHKRLTWHYRSRHESLITFSNRQYYDNDLLTFPSPELELGGVQFHHVANARYDKGRSRTNRLEAEALVKELVSRLRDSQAARRSYGVVTFSQAQQELVENLLDEERRKHPDIEHHFGEDPPNEGEPVFVKNLESVQGDERDVIFFSVCYAIDEAGKLSMNFGPLNRDGGERRLNVAITRAKHEVLVFSGLRGDQIDLTRTQKRGVRDLKYFLEYAERGPRALVAATTSSSLGDADSEFERMVAARIRAAGYVVHHQVGCSGYRIDLAIVDPSAPGRYLIGVECDGATYHRAATARDRDKLRQSVLEELGWKLHRIWSTDWWHNSDVELQKLLEAVSLAKEARHHLVSQNIAAVGTIPQAVEVGHTIEELNEGASNCLYKVADFSAFSDRISPERFHDPDYEPVLKELVSHVLDAEAPILDELLVQRIARAHGFQRCGRVISQRVLAFAKRFHFVKNDPIGGVFVWPNKETVATWSQCRAPHSEQDIRSIEEIAYEELSSAIPNSCLGEPAIEIARRFGNRRLTALARSRIEKAIRLCSQNADERQDSHN